MNITRNHLTTELRHAIESLIDGGSRRSVVFVTGEAGIGKTTLLDELRGELAAGDVRCSVAGVACSTPVAGESIGGVEALEPWARIMSTLVTAPSPAKTAGVLAGELARAWVRVIPVVGDVLESAIDTARIVRRHLTEHETESAPRQRHGETVVGQQQMFQQYVNFLAELSASTPLVLMLDDAHWADASSANLLFTAARQLEGRPVAFVVAYRPSDAATSRADAVHPILRVRSELERYGLAIEVGVPTLDDADVDRLLRARYAHYRNDDDFERWLVRISGGNPLFVTQFLATLEEDGHIDAQTGSVRTGYESIAIPRTAQSVLEERVRRMTDESRELLRYASVEGDTFTATVLSRVTEMAQLRLLQRLRLVEESHALIQSLGRRPVYASETPAWRFTHLLVQKVLYDGLGDDERLMIHDVTLSVLLEEWDSARAADVNVAGFAARIAAHASIVGDHVSASRMLLEGARESWRRHAESETMRMVEGGLAAVERAIAGGGDGGALTETRADLLAIRAEVHRVRGRLLVALEEYREAFAQGAEASVARRVRLRAVMAEILKTLRRFDEAEAMVREALIEADALGDAEAKSDVLRTAGNIFRDRGQAHQAFDSYRESLDVAEAAGLERCAAKALDNMGQACRMLGRYDEARACYERSGAISARVGDDRTRAILLNNVGALEFRTGHLEKARENFARSGEIFAVTGDARLAALSRSNLGDIDMAGGDHAAALAHFEAALAMTRQMDDPALVAAMLRNCAEALHEMDRNTEALTTLDEARLHLDSDVDVAAASDVLLLDARIALAAGDLERATASLDSCELLAPRTGEVELAPTIEGWRGLVVAARAQDARDAERARLLATAITSLRACVAGLERLEHREIDAWRAHLARIERSASSGQTETTTTVAHTRGHSTP